MNFKGSVLSMCEVYGLPRRCQKSISHRNERVGFLCFFGLETQSSHAERDYHWLMCHDDKIACIAGKDTVDPVKYGGKSYDEWVYFSLHFYAPGSQYLTNNSELPFIAKDHYRQEEEQKFRCLTCGKMFKSAGYVCKHISNKHPELLRRQRGDVRGKPTFPSTLLLSTEI
jgi:uncharacterized C2H2 Zn-finger protein